MFILCTQLIQRYADKMPNKLISPFSLDNWYNLLNSRLFNECILWPLNGKRLYGFLRPVIAIKNHQGDNYITENTKKLNKPVHFESLALFKEHSFMAVILSQKLISSIWIAFYRDTTNTARVNIYIANIYIFNIYIYIFAYKVGRVELQIICAPHAAILYFK